MSSPTMYHASLRWLLALAAMLGTAAPMSAIPWEQAQRQGEVWFKSPDGKQVVDNVLLFQFPSGGWPKNTDLAKPLSDDDKRQLARRRDRTQKQSLEFESWDSSSGLIVLSVIFCSG